jgi:murein DD-endopeptidase MepM/ murein hydrolase activator NlpD
LAPSTRTSRTSQQRLSPGLRRYVNEHPRLTPYAALIEKNARRYGLDPVKYAALIVFESGGNPNARSHANAVGLVQIHLPSHPNVSERQARNPAFALQWGARFFAAQLRKYGTYEAAYRRGYNPGYKGAGPFAGLGGEERPGGFIFPVLGGAKYTNDWGAPRATTGRHQGTDLFAAAGTPVVAVEDGTITKMGDSRIGGLRIWLNGKFYYAHLSGFAKGLKQGAKVKAGQIIGYVGNTGDARGTPPHLHFGYSPDGSQGGNWANPYPMLKGTATLTSSAPGDPGGHVSVTGAPATAVPNTQQVSAPVGPQYADFASPANVPAPDSLGAEVPGSAQMPYMPPDPIETWRLLASDPFASPETRRYARLMEEDGQRP